MLNKLMKMRHQNEEGFTLIELMIVVVIIGVLAAIAIPIFMNQQKAAHDATVKSDLKNTVLAIQTLQAQGKNFNDPGVFYKVAKLSDRSNYASTTAYGLLCFNSNSYAVYLTSVTGNSYTYSSVTGKLKEDPGFPRSGASACPDAGIMPNTWWWTQDSNWASH